MSSLAVIAAAIVLTTGQPVPAQPQAAPSANDTTVLDEIVVEGRQLDRYVRDFVNEVAAPARRRGLARWGDDVCVGVANIRADAAQAIADRVSEVAVGLGLSPGDPGCSPNILIIAAEDGQALASELVSREPAAFRLGTSAADLGEAALRAFQQDDRPVRWWMTSIPVDSTTNVATVTLPGRRRHGAGKPIGALGGSMDSPLNYATTIRTSASRLISGVRDDILRAVVIIDDEALDRVSLSQLADYAAMVSLAQIDPEAEVVGYRSILGLFSDEDAPSGLTDWDMAYLHALYATHPPRLNPGSQVSAVINEVIATRRAAAQGGTETP